MYKIDIKEALYPIQKVLDKINKCFSGHFFEKQMRQAGFYFYFLFPKKQMRPLFLFFIWSKHNEAPFFVHFKHKNADILILTFEKNE